MVIIPSIFSASSFELFVRSASSRFLRLKFSVLIIRVFPFQLLKIFWSSGSFVFCEAFQDLIIIGSEMFQFKSKANRFIVFLSGFHKNLLYDFNGIGILGF
ncbi:hypothetical protein M9991_03460 [Chryseobacterium gallinarum]|uniref:hypothetical protein n=1 Tax=Chryseobacterium gallinarum TaxID=1324352 RepID=UPI002024722C|nr:hypothetical protein [Chryseobacterium gallinarum]MCL8535917.1 hypothetical protein [Chryseobacterium gallinarum]